MIGLDTIVYAVVFLLVGGLILGLCWWLITYIEAQGLGPPIMFKVIRIVFIVLVVLLLISILLSFLGHPIVRF